MAPITGRLFRENSKKKEKLADKLLTEDTIFLTISMKRHHLMSSGRGGERAIRAFPSRLP